MTDASNTLPVYPRILGCIIGGMVGDAMAAHLAQSSAPYPTAKGSFGVTNASLLALFTAEGYIRAYVRAALKGICHPPSVVQHALLRWAHVQGTPLRAQIANSTSDPWPDGWLVGLPAFAKARVGGDTCRKALKDVDALGHPATNTAGFHDPEALMRAAVLGVATSPRDAFDVAEATSRMTHPSIDAYLPAACFAKTISLIVEGSELYPAYCRVSEAIEEDPRAKATYEAMDRAADQVDENELARSDEALCADPAKDAKDVLSIVIYAAHQWKTFEGAVTFAAQAAGAAGAIATGQLRGALHGIDDIPSAMHAAIELLDVAEQIAQDLHAVRNDTFDAEAGWSRYPGW